MKRHIYILTVFLSFLFMNCSNDDDTYYYLENSIFIADPETPDLPIYSESGYNTFGVRLDRNTIRYDSDNYPLKVIVKNGNTALIFDGHRNNYADYKITFTINNFSPGNEAALMELNNKSFDLKSNDISVEIEDDGYSSQPEILSGTLNIIRTQNLYVDDSYKGVILSGKFNFKAIINNTPMSFSDGRFDIIIGNSNFYQLN